MPVWGWSTVRPVPMGGLVAVPHGVACANLLPFAIQATVDNLAAAHTPAARAAIGKFACIGTLFGATGDEPLDSSRHLVAGLYHWLDRLSIPRLGQLGVTANHIDRLVALADNKNNPLPLTETQIRQMLHDRC